MIKVSNQTSECCFNLFVVKAAIFVGRERDILNRLEGISGYHSIIGVRNSVAQCKNNFLLLMKLRTPFMHRQHKSRRVLSSLAS